MSNEFTLTLNRPITEAQWDAIDVDFEHMNEITFHTKHGKEVKFVKASAQPEDYAHGFVDGYKQGKKDAQPERNTCDYWDNESGYCALSRPSAQPERKTGKWIYEGVRGRFPACRCSVCGNVENADWAMISGEVNFCPNCGVDMRQRREENDD